MTAIPKVSVIVPVYGVEKYLHQCVSSILTQTLKDIEIILVNDGSKDRCPEMIEEYARQDARVRTIHQANSGYGKAVNVGMRAARGEYVAIVEPDDWIEGNMYEQLYELAIQHQVQMVRCNYFDYTQAKGDKKIDLLPMQDLERVMSPKIHSAVFYCRPTVWAAIYKRSFLQENNIEMLESPGASFQDVGFNFKVLARADRVWLTPHAYVHYRSDNENSSTFSNDKVFCIIDEWAEIDRYMDSYPDDKEASYILRAHIRLDNYMWNLKRVAPIHRESLRKVVAAEFHELLRQGALWRGCFTRRKWMNIRKSLEPHSILVRLSCVLQLLTGLIIKSRIENRKRRWYFLFGLIKVYEQDVLRPSFYEGRR